MAGAKSNESGIVRIDSVGKYAISGLVGAITVAVAMAVAFADIRSDAATAKKGVHDHGIRIRVLEEWKADDRQWRIAVQKQLDRIEKLLEKEQRRGN